MALTADKIELAKQIADVLEEGIKAGPHVFYGSTYYTGSDYCKNLIKPLLEKYHIDTLLESLPPHGVLCLCPVLTPLGSYSIKACLSQLSIAMRMTL